MLCIFLLNEELNDLELRVLNHTVLAKVVEVPEILSFRAYQSIVIKTSWE